MSDLNAPIARKQHTEKQLHGITLTDDYAWLRQKDDPEVTAYLEAENAYAEANLAPLASLHEDLYREMLSHIQQTDVSVPYFDDGYRYHTRTQERLQCAILCSRSGTMQHPPDDAARDSRSVDSGVSPAGSGKPLLESYGCSGCHSIAGVGNTASPLDGIGSKRTSDELKKLIVSPPSGSTMPAMSVPADDLNCLVAYLLTLKAH